MSLGVRVIARLQVRVAPGAHTFVLGEYATLRVDGAGSSGVGQGDRAKWVNDGDTCNDADAAGSGDQPVVAGADAVSVTFMFSAAAPSLVLCYRYGDLDWRLVPEVTAVVAHLSDGDVAVVAGVTTRVHFAGVGIRDGDIVSWVPRNTACTGGLPEHA